MSWRLLRAIPERVLFGCYPSCILVPPCGLSRVSRFCPSWMRVIKAMAVHYPIFQVTFLRFAFGSWWRRRVVTVLRPGWPSSETIKANLVRSLVGVPPP